MGNKIRYNTIFLPCSTWGFEGTPDGIDTMDTLPYEPVPPPALGVGTIEIEAQVLKAVWWIIFLGARKIINLCKFQHGGN